MDNEEYLKHYGSFSADDYGDDFSNEDGNESWGDDGVDDGYSGEEDQFYESTMKSNDISNNDTILDDDYANEDDEIRNDNSEFIAEDNESLNSDEEAVEDDAAILDGTLASYLGLIHGDNNDGVNLLNESKLDEYASEILRSAKKDGKSYGNSFDLESIMKDYDEVMSQNDDYGDVEVDYVINMGRTVSRSMINNVIADVADLKKNSRNVKRRSKSFNGIQNKKGKVENKMAKVSGTKLASNGVKPFIMSNKIASEESLDNQEVAEDIWSIMCGEDTDGAASHQHTAEAMKLSSHVVGIGKAVQPTQRRKKSFLSDKAGRLPLINQPKAVKYSDSEIESDIYDHDLGVMQEGDDWEEEEVVVDVRRGANKNKQKKPQRFGICCLSMLISMTFSIFLCFKSFLTTM